jgi:hypothetical protein
MDKNPHNVPLRFLKDIIFYMDSGEAILCPRDEFSDCPPDTSILGVITSHPLVERNACKAFKCRLDYKTMENEITSTLEELFSGK